MAHSLSIGDKVRYNGIGAFENEIDDDDLLTIVRVKTDTEYPYVCQDNNGDTEAFNESQLTLNEKGEHMANIKDVPVNLKKFLDDDYTALYQLDWIDKDLNLTATGREALQDFLLEKNITEIGAVAIAEVRTRLAAKDEESDDE